MHTEILTDKQKEVLPLLKKFKKSFYLVGGTAIALHIGLKAFELGGRAKWKDYVDLYFILKDHYTIEDIAKRAVINFGGAFNKKLFKEQLSYFKDINYEESVTFLKGFEISDEKIKKKLIDIATEAF